MMFYLLYFISCILSPLFSFLRLLFWSYFWPSPKISARFDEWSITKIFSFFEKQYECFQIFQNMISIFTYTTWLCMILGSSFYFHLKKSKIIPITYYQNNSQSSNQNFWIELKSSFWIEKSKKSKIKKKSKLNKTKEIKNKNKNKTNDYHRVHRYADWNIWLIFHLLFLLSAIFLCDHFL